MTKEKKKALMDEISTLYLNGHGEALSFWGDRQVRLYNQGLFVGALIFCGLEFVYRFHKSKAANSKT